MKIADIREPALFQKLVHRLFVAERGVEFQLVDDSGGDRGNDGYDSSRAILYSIYCPEKPESANYMRKATEDLLKAARLRDQPGYRITSWVFVTPTSLREPHQAQLRQRADELGLAIAFLSDVHLEEIFRRHPHLHDDFPELAYPVVADELKRLRVAVESLGGLVTQPLLTEGIATTDGVTAGDALRSSDFTGFVSPQLADLLNRLDGGDASALAQLQRYRMEAQDHRDYLDALHIELQYMLDRNDRESALHLATVGLKRARHAGLPTDRAILAATVAHLNAIVLMRLEMEFDSDIEFTKISGFPFQTADQIEEVRSRLATQHAEVDSLLKEAFDSSRESDNIIGLYIVLLRRAAVLTQSFFLLAVRRKLNRSGAVDEAISSLKRKVEDCYEIAIRIARALGDEHRLATAYGNLANDLDTFGDRAKARDHAEHALALAHKSHNHVQAVKTKQLLEKIDRETRSA